MRVGAPLLVLAMLQAGGRVAADPSHFLYQRQVGGAAVQGAPQSVCAVLDATALAHAQATLADVRLYRADGSKTEVPYVLTASQTALGSDTAKVLNLGVVPGRQAARRGALPLAFDLEMPNRPYTNVNLNVEGRDFLATAKVTGRRSPDDGGGTYLGTFTLFDLSGQRLGRSTTLPLSESSFPVLHVDLEVKPSPQSLPGPDAGARAERAQVPSPAMVRGAEVPPSREAQTVYRLVESTDTIVQRGRESVATFTVPAHVPVERVSFVMAPGDHVNFSRDMRVTAQVNGDPAPETVTGTILRVKLQELGREVRDERLAVPAVLGANERDAAKVEVAVENGDDRPLALQSVRLEMRERKLCFDASAGPVEMMYGDANLKAPVYDYGRTFQAEQKTQTVALGAEVKNPNYVAAADTRTFTEHHPEVVWLALLAVVAVLGIVAFRSAGKV